MLIYQSFEFPTSVTLMDPPLIMTPVQGREHTIIKAGTDDIYEFYHLADKPLIITNKFKAYIIYNSTYMIQ